MMKCSLSTIGIFIYLVSFQCNAQSWFQLPSVPSPGRDDAVGFAIGENGYLFSGLVDGIGLSNTVYRYNAKWRTWTQINDFPGKPRQYAQVIEADGGAYIIGGNDFTAEGLNDCWFFDGSTWTQKADLPGIGRWGTTGFKTKDGFIVATGNTKIGVTNEVWKYVFSKDEWQKLDTFPGIPRRDATNLNVYGKHYIGSGTVYNPERQLNDWFIWKEVMEVFAPLKDTLFEKVGFASGVEQLIVGGKRNDVDFTEKVFSLWPLEQVKVMESYPEGRVKGVCGFKCADTLYFMTGLKQGNVRLNTMYGIVLNQINQQPDIALFYPNPGCGDRILIPKKDGEIEIVDLNGKLIFKTALKSGIQMNLGSYLNQMNVLIIKSKDEVQIIRSISFECLK